MKSILLTSILLFQVNSFALDSKSKALHLLNRFTFGPKPGELETLAKQGDKGLKNWFEAQIHPETSEDETLVKKLNQLPSLKLSCQQMIKAYPKDNAIKKSMMMAEDYEGRPKDILKELVMQKILRASQSRYQFQEVMLDFWFNHFNVNFDKGPVKYSITSFERDVIRPHLFGKFEDLLLATARSPSMLFYLDNQQSRKGHINENYARELLELHTLGVDGGYTQLDIQEAAKVLSGWGIEKPKEISEFKFFKGQHELGPKNILGHQFQNKNGIKEGEELIVFLAHHPSTARFIAKKLAIKFVSDNPSEKTISHLAAVFEKTGGDLTEMYKAVFALDEFWSDANFQSKIKTPFEYLVSSVRLLNADIIPQIDRINFLNQYFNQTGEALYRCQPPTGFKAVSEYWVNSGAMVNRINLALRLTRNEIPQIEFDRNLLLEPIKQNKYKNQMDLINYFNQSVFNSVINSKTLVKLDGFVDDSKNYQDDGKQPLPLHYYQVDKILGLMLSTPEFQRR